MESQVCHSCIWCNFSRLTELRFALNIKGIPYKTEWVDYPDIAALYVKLGIPDSEKHADGTPYYSLPVLSDPSTGTILYDSATIVKYLDKTYPDTHVFFPKGTAVLHAGFLSAWGRIQNTMWDLVCYPAYLSLREGSKHYYRTTREASEGKPLEEIATAQAWTDTEKAFGRLDSWYKAGTEGDPDLVMGDAICYADLQVVSGLMWAMVCFGEESKEWARFCSWHGGRWKRIVDKFAPHRYIDQ